jgi:nucleoside-diphosphate-sugar epimerase
MHVSDVVNAYLRIADHMDRTDVVGKAFNFGTGKPSSVLNLVNKIIEISGKSHLKPVILGKEVKMINEQYLSSDRANSLLKWKANKSLEDGLRETIEWYSANESLWKHLI